MTPDEIDLALEREIARYLDRDTTEQADAMERDLREQGVPPAEALEIAASFYRDRRAQIIAEMPAIRAQVEAFVARCLVASEARRDSGAKLP